MNLVGRYRLWRARTVSATALVWAFAGGAALAVPATIWSGLGQREVVRVVRGGAETHAVALSPALAQSLKDIDRWARPSTANPHVEALLGEPAGAVAVLDPACGPAEVVHALERQLAAQRTVAGTRLAIDPFATTSFAALSERSAEAVRCLGAALDAAEDGDRVQVVRLVARLATVDGRGAEAAKAALEREAMGASDVRAVYALHGYLAVESDLRVAGEVVQRSVRAHVDPMMRSALREVATRKLIGLVSDAGLPDGVSPPRDKLSALVAGKALL